MNTEKIIDKIRSGDGSLDGVLEYYAKTRLEHELMKYIDEEEIRPTLLYVLSELPRVGPDVVDEIKVIISKGDLSGRELLWANDIVLDNG